MMRQMALFHSFLCLSHIHFVYIHHLYPFICPWTSRCLHVLAIMNSASMNVRVHVSFWIVVLSGEWHSFDQNHRTGLMIAGWNQMLIPLKHGTWEMECVPCFCSIWLINGMVASIWSSYAKFLSPSVMRAGAGPWGGDSWGWSPCEWD